MYIHGYTMYVNVYTTYVHGITNCLNRFSWPTQRCQCRGERYHPTARSCKGRWVSGQSLSRRWWFFLCQARCCRNRGGHQQVYQWPGEPGATADFDRLHTLLSRLPVPVATNGSNMLHTAALDGGILPKMDEEQQKRFTPSELLLYKHAVEYR